MATWDGPSSKHFFPLELQEFDLEIMEPQLYEILQSVPEFLAHIS